MDLHGQIMNIQFDINKVYDIEFPEDFIDAIKLAYKIGHRDARHEAAELSLGISDIEGNKE